VLGDLIGTVTKHLKKGSRIRIGGLGILVVRKRAAREGRNPATGETIHIKASKKVAFRPAKELKEAVMVAGPAATAVASPETDIVAVDVFDELQVTVLEMSFVEPSE